MRKFFRIIGRIFLVLCVVITLGLGYIVVTNFDNLGLALETIFLIKSSYLEEVETGRIVEGAIMGMVDALGDDYSYYLPPEELSSVKEHLQGSFGGVGIYVGMRENMLTIIAPIAGTPADKAGLKSGDIISAIEDKTALGMSLDEAVQLMKGEPGTKVSLKIKRSSENEELSFEIMREVISVPSVEAEMLMTDPNIAYIRLTMFATNTYENLVDELQKLADEGFSGLILDLRDNPGGEVNSVTAIADMFLPSGPIMYTVDRSEKYESVDARENHLTMPLAVLINGGSASASEILAGAIQDTGVGTIIGTQSFGKGRVQTVYTLPGGAGVKLTTAKYLTPKKRDIHEKGITPDFIIEDDVILPNGEDPQLQKAVEILRREIGL